MILNWPEPSVVVVRALSISAGLATSTVTPDSKAPETSFTSPAMVLVCAEAATGSSTRHVATNVRSAKLRIPILQELRRDPRSGAVSTRRFHASTVSYNFRWFCVDFALYRRSSMWSATRTPNFRIAPFQTCVRIPGTSSSKDGGTGSNLHGLTLSECQAIDQGRGAGGIS